MKEAKKRDSVSACWNMMIVRKGLEEEAVRHVFLDLATALVDIVIGFSVVFATELKLQEIRAHA